MTALAAAVGAKDRPILFSAPMVRAILAGTKTQTRRIVKPQPSNEAAACSRMVSTERGLIYSFHDSRGVPVPWRMDIPEGYIPSNAGPFRHIGHCPYGVPGDRLWVRETWGVAFGVGCAGIAYRADNVGDEWDVNLDELQHGHWRPSIHMPREHSRITLEITDVHVHRLQEISDVEAFAEGIQSFVDSNRSASGDGTARGAFKALWQSINGDGSWNANPWVWALTFKRITSAPSPAEVERRAVRD